MTDYSLPLIVNFGSILSAFLNFLVSVLFVCVTAWILFSKGGAFWWCWDMLWDGLGLRDRRGVPGGGGAVGDVHSGQWSNEAAHDHPLEADHAPGGRRFGDAGGRVGGGGGGGTQVGGGNIVGGGGGSVGGGGGGFGDAGFG